VRASGNRRWMSWMLICPCHACDVDLSVQRVPLRPSTCHDWARRDPHRVRRRPRLYAMVSRGLAGLAIAGAALAACSAWFEPEPTPIADLSANVPHRMTPGQVERVALATVASRAAGTEGEILPPQVLKMTLLRPKQAYAVGGRPSIWMGGGPPFGVTTWAVEWRGTVRGCAPEGRCETLTAGTFFIEDSDAGLLGWVYRDQ
jgi:hypothetical protein